MQKKTIILGIDGANWELLDKLIALNKIPTIGRLKSEINSKTLESTIPPLTGPAWITFATGKNPGEHGCFGFTIPTESLTNTTAITTDTMKSQTFFEEFSKEGKKCISINLPGSYPPKTKDITVTSLLTRGDDFFFPESKREKYNHLLDGYKLVPDPTVTSKTEFIEELLEIERVRFDLGKTLFTDEEWHTFFYLFSGSDWVNHKYYGDMILDPEHAGTTVYEAIDTYVTWFLENKDDDTELIIMSDHGFTTYSGSFYANEWLKKEGYLSFSTEEIKHDTHERRHAEAVGKENQSMTLDLRKHLGSIKNIPWLFKLAKTVYHKIRFLLPFSVEERATPNPKKSSAYYLGGVMGIYVNDTKRFSDGSVSTEKRDEIINEIITKLRNLRSPEGQQIFENVIRKEDYYHGASLESAPDILLEFGSYWPKGGNGPVFVSENINNHQKDGIILSTYNLDDISTLEDVAQLIKK